MTDTSKPIYASQVRGTISGFTKITVGDDVVDADNTPLDPVTLTFPEILEALKYIRAHFDPDRLYQLQNQIQEHVHDYNNPHQLTAETLGIDTYRDLFQLWVNEGWGTEEVLFKQFIFQEFQIGTLDDIDNWSLDKLVTYDLAEHYFARHEADGTAHSEMIHYHLPGTAKADLPVHALYGEQGLQTNDWFVAGDFDAIITTTARTGRLEEYRSSSVPVDYSRGEGRIIACGVPVTNLYAPSHPFENGSNYYGCTYQAAKTIYADGRPNNAVSLSETGVEDVHGISLHPVTLVAGKKYTASFYISASKFPIECFDNQLNTRGVFLNSPSDVISRGADTVDIYLDNFGYENTGYVRVGYTLTATADGPVRFGVRTRKNGVAKYPGVPGEAMFTLDAAMIEDYDSMSPHIRNMTETPYTRGAFIVATRLSLDQTINGTFGAVIDDRKTVGIQYACDGIKVSCDGSLYNTTVNLIGEEDISYRSSANSWVTWTPGRVLVRQDNNTSSSRTTNPAIRPNINSGKFITIGGALSEDETTIEGGCLVYLDDLMYYASTSSTDNLLFLSGEYADD